MPANERVSNAQSHEDAVLSIPDGIIDVHCHVLPGVDDGSRDMKESIALLKSAYQQGVVSCIATPHYSRRSEDRDRCARQAALCRELQEAAKEAIHPDFHVFFGQETYYHEELQDRIDGKVGWTIAGSRYVLVEFSPMTDYSMIRRGLRQVLGIGYVPILAHMERYPAIRERVQERGGKTTGIDELRSMGVILQMNYDSLTGSIFNREVRWCRDQVKRGIIDLMGSDMHRTDFRPPELTEPLKWMEKNLTKEMFLKITRENAVKVLLDEEF